ncbi:MAG: DegT/DnrJ/EryC1/StrS family aminotransferase [Chloroflexi bacterium]|nr:DegT/DnrJ/EryC1/StrS family aminotransferase [Chloroflexota bacterium]MBV9894532.1 DegT/DnrJ/EryC1/StrS family aminotransferase [Chloroflexota bacterium]
MIPITKPVFDDDDLALIQEPLKSGWVVQGKYVQQFEDHFNGFTGSRNSVAVSSCTSALHIAMAALGLQPGDEVLVPAFTWIATPNCVEYMQARPIFVDVSLDTFNIDADHVERHITPRTKGIIPVHLFGLPADMAPILDIANRHGLWVVEDAACGFDSWYKGQHVGTFGEYGCFSFHPRKAITTGEGGMLTTQRRDLAELARSLRDHGASRTDLERHEQKYSFLLAEYQHLGFNFRMTDIQGALGVTQMRKAEVIMAGRREAAARYNDLLAEVEWLRRPFQDSHSVHGYQSYVCLFQPQVPRFATHDAMFNRRNAMMASLEAKGIITRQGTHAPPHLHYYSNKYQIRPHDYPNAYMAERLTVTLPLYAGMSEDESEQVVEQLRAVFKATSGTRAA